MGRHFCCMLQDVYASAWSLIPCYCAGNSGTDFISVDFISWFWKEKKHVFKGLVYLNLSWGILFCRWVFWCILDEWEHFSKLRNCLREKLWDSFLFSLSLRLMALMDSQKELLLPNFSSWVEIKISFAGVPSLPIMLVVSSSFPNLCSTGGRNALPCDSTYL